MKKLISLRIICLAFVLGSLVLFSCTPNRTSIPQQCETIQDVAVLFRDARKFIRFSNCRMEFGSQLDSAVAARFLHFDVDEIEGNQTNLHIKGAFRVRNISDSSFFFIYGLVGKADSLVKEIRVRTIHHDSVVDDIPIIQFLAGYTYDYYASGNTDKYKEEWETGYIRVLAYNPEDREHQSFYGCLANGTFSTSSIIPDTLFIPKHFYIKTDRVLIFNDYQTKEYIDEEGRRFTITGKLIEHFGDKGERGILIELDHLFQGERYASLDLSGCFGLDYQYASCVFHLRKEKELVKVEGSFGWVFDVAGEKILVSNEVYFDQI